MYIATHCKLRHSMSDNKKFQFWPIVYQLIYEFGTEPAWYFLFKKTETKLRAKKSKGKNNLRINVLTNEKNKPNFIQIERCQSG